MVKIAVIGGGASGLFFANYLEYLLNNENTIESLRKNVKIVVFERLEKVGKKILVTGNGRCNLTNLNVSKEKYNNSKFVGPIISKFTPKELIGYFNNIGLYTYSDLEGRVYPYSDSANSVLDVLRINLRNYDISEKTNNDVKKITKTKEEKFIIETNRQDKFEFDYVVIATGGAASPVHGSNGSGFSLAKMLKHHVTNIEPGLTQVYVDPNEVKTLAGIKVHPKVMLYDKKKKSITYENNGELLFKPDALSGIVMFQASSFISHNPSNYDVILDLLPDLNDDETFDLLNNRISIYNKEEISNLFTGIFNKMLGFSIIKKAKVMLAMKCSELKESDIRRLVGVIKKFTIPIKKVAELDKAQVTCGGVNTEEVNNKTMMSKLCDNLYFLGEVLDVDGDCGGYNLHFAFSSAYIAALDLFKKIKVGSVIHE